MSPKLLNLIVLIIIPTLIKIITMVMLSFGEHKSCCYCVVFIMFNYQSFCKVIKIKIKHESSRRSMKMWPFLLFWIF